MAQYREEQMVGINRSKEACRTDPRLMEQALWRDYRFSSSSSLSRFIDSRSVASRVRAATGADQPSDGPSAEQQQQPVVRSHFRDQIGWLNARLLLEEWAGNQFPSGCGPLEVGEGD